MNRIKDLFKISKGKKEVENCDGSTRYIQIEDLRNNCNIKHTFPDQKSVKCSEHDIILAWDGANAGTISYGLNGVIGSTLAKLSPTSDKVFIPFAGKFLQSKFQYLRHTATGATIPHISRKALENLQIPLPPIEEQKRIAAILDAADQHRQKTKALLDKYDELAQSIFLDMFGDPVTNPKGWEVIKLKRLIAEGPTNGLYKPSKDYGSGTPIVRIDSFYNDYVDLDCLKKVNITDHEQRTFGLSNGDILINRVNSKTHLGKVGLLKGLHEATVYESNMMRIRFAPQKANPVFMLFMLSSKHVKRQILTSSKDAVNQSSINQKDVNSFEIPNIPISLQNNFELKVIKLHKQKELLLEETSKIEALFQSLLQKAFKGEL